MKKQIRKTIYVEPTPKGRPRIAVDKEGHPRPYTPESTRQAQTLIMFNIRQFAMEDKAFFDRPVPLRLAVIFYRPKPDSYAKKVVLPTMKPDLDNYLKNVSDACERFVYSNDSQITTVIAKKRFGSPPRIELLIEEDPGE